MERSVFILTIFTIVSTVCFGREIDLRNIGIPVHIDLDSFEHGDVLNLVKSHLAVIGEGTVLQTMHDSLTNLKTTDIAVTTSQVQGNPFDCVNDTIYIMQALSSPLSPEFKYLDAAAKVPEGLLQGKWIWLGDYQECSSITKLQNKNTKKFFGPEYFSAYFYLNGKPIVQQYPLVAGFCLPDSCDNVTVTLLLNTGIATLKKSVPALKSLNISAIGAAADSDYHLDRGAIAYIVISGILCTFMILGTLVDYFCSKPEPAPPTEVNTAYDEPYADQNDRTGLLSNELFSNNIQDNKVNCRFVNGKLLEFCKAFSLYTNGKKLFSTKTADGPLACLNGIRVLSMWWVILGHTYAFVLTFVDNILEAENISKRFSFQPILNGTFSVDSFFFLSGLLVSYLVWKEFKEKGAMNWFYYVVHRYWRLSPLYAFVIFYYAYVMKYTIQGPLKSFAEAGFDAGSDICKKYWWTNLLYINNMYPDYGDLSKECLSWGWYLANDMQFYLVIGPIVLVSFRLNKYAGIIMSAFFIVSCVVTRVGLVVYFGIYDELGKPTKHLDNLWAQHGALYQRPYARWSVYVVGMLVGYILASSNNRIKIHRLLALVGWCCAIASGLAVIYGLYYYSDHSGTHMTLTASAFYISLSRTVWGCCLGWIVLACVSGNGGVIKDILSWRMWAPLGRLTYAAYLVHPIVIFTYYLEMHQLIHFTDLTMVYVFIGNLVVSYAIAFMVSMLVEAPMIQLEKLVLIPVGKQLEKLVLIPVGKQLQRAIGRIPDIYRRIRRNNKTQ